MQVVKKPKGGTNFVEYSLDGNMLSFGDDELIINLKKKERDFDAEVDICKDYSGGLIASAGGDAERYLAQIFIPAREYVDEDTGEQDEEGREIINHNPVPFSTKNVTLTLWDRKEGE